MSDTQSWVWVLLRVFLLTMTVAEKYSRHKNLKYVVPDSQEENCAVEKGCSLLYCAVRCTYNSNCRSFSHSEEQRQCVLNPWYVLSTSSHATQDSSWSTFERRSRECDSQPCFNGGLCVNSVSGTVTCTCVGGYTGQFCQTAPSYTHCKAALDAGSTVSGVQTVSPVTGQPVQVYCDQVTDGGGWLVFQRRQDGSEDFDRTMQVYKDGFGDLTAEFWLGLDNMYAFTSRWQHELRVDMGSSQSNTKYAKYSNFALDAGTFTIRFDSFTEGTAGDCLGHQKNYPFTTPAKDSSFCGSLYYGAWWFANTCMYCNLNGRYGATNGGGVKWYTYGGSGNSHSWVEMKMRPIV